MTVSVTTGCVMVVTLTGTKLVLRWGCFIDSGQLLAPFGQTVTVTTMVENTVDVMVSTELFGATLVVGTVTPPVAVCWETSVTGQTVVATMMVSVVT